MFLGTPKYTQNTVPLGLAWVSLPGAGQRLLPRAPFVRISFPAPPFAPLQSQTTVAPATRPCFVVVAVDGGRVYGVGRLIIP